MSAITPSGPLNLRVNMHRHAGRKTPDSSTDTVAAKNGDHVATLSRLQFVVHGLASPKEALRLERRLCDLDGVLTASVSFHDMSAVVSVLDEDVEADTIRWIAQTEGCAAALVEAPTLPEARHGVETHQRLARRAMVVSLPAAIVVLGSFLTRDLALGGALFRGIITDIQLFLTALVFWFGRELFQYGVAFRSSLHASRETPLALGALVAVLHGLWAFFAHEEPRFDAAVALVAGYHIGCWLQSHFVLRAQISLTDLRAVWPREATVRRGESHFRVAIDMLQDDDLVIIGRGDTVPADGLVVETFSDYLLVEESLVLGDGARRQKQSGDRVVAGSRVEDGAAVIRPECWGRDSLLGRMLDVVSGAAGTKAPSQRRASIFAAWLSPICALAAAATFVVWRQTWPDSSIWDSISPALAVLASLAPWTIGWASDIPVLVAMTRAVRRGVLFRDAQALEHARNVEVMLIEKAGTLTVGHPEVENIDLFNGASLQDAVTLLKAVEAKSDHAIAVAIRAFAADTDVAGARDPVIRSFRQIPGSGVIAAVDESEVVFGALDLVEGKGVKVQTEQRMPNALYLAVDGVLAARLRIFDPIRDDGISLIRRLRTSGIRPMLITSSPAGEADRVAREVGVDIADIRAGIDGDSHSQAVIAVRAADRIVGVVGQATEDAPALSAADIAFALFDAGAAPLAALGAHDLAFEVVSVRPGEGGVESALNFSERAYGRAQENFVLASGLTSVALVAALGWIGPLGAVGVMLLGLAMVGTNGLRMHEGDR